MLYVKNSLLSGSNHGPLVLEVTALPNEPHHCPKRNFNIRPIILTTQMAEWHQRVYPVGERSESVPLN